MEKSLTRDEFEALTICRNKAREVRRMERKINAFLPTAEGYYKSPQWTGMPGSRDVHGLDGSARKNEAEHAALEQAREELKQMKEAAMRIICGLDWKMQDFCVAYFINGEDIDSVAEMIGRDRTTCWRKLKMLRGGDGNGSFRRRLSEKRNKMQQNVI